MDKDHGPHSRRLLWGMRALRKIVLCGRMSPSRTHHLVAYLLCFAALLALFSSDDAGRLWLSCRLSFTENKDVKYRYHYPIDQSDGEMYLSTCCRGTYACVHKNGSVVPVSSVKLLSEFGTLAEKHLFPPYDNREQLFTVPFLHESFLQDLFPYCQYKPTYSMPHEVPRYHGVFEVQMLYLYPCDCSWQYRTYLFDPFLQNLCLSDEEANFILTLFMSRLNAQYPEQFTLLKVVNIEVRYDFLKGSRILLELLLKKDNDLKTYRISHYYFLPWHSEEMCDLSNHQWRRDTHVHFLVITKNLGMWVKHFIRNMEEIQQLTGDTDFSVVIVDFNSSDIDVRAELERSRLAHHHAIVLKNQVFHKTLAHNVGLHSIKDNNSIVFTVDLHLDIPPNMIESVRKHTIQGWSGYAPALLRLKEGASPRTAVLTSQWTSIGRWEVWGYGLFSLYKSDWSAVGNMNLEYGEKWGGEDYDLVDRVLREGYEVNRLFHMKLFHHHHDHKGMWTDKSPSIS